MHENVFPGGMPVEGKRGNYIALAATLAALGALLLCSQAALESARAGLGLCAQMIVPSLLPFFILSSLLQQLGLPGILGRWLSPVTQRLFGIGGAGASALLLGVTGGYPLGADAVARLRRSGTLTREQAERALAFCNNSGPAFLVGAAGVGVFHSAGYGLLLYGVHVLSAVIVGMLFAPRSGGFPPEERAQIAAVSLSQALPEAVRNAVRAVLTVSGFVVTFSVVTGVLDASGLLPALVGTERCAAGAGAALCPRAVHGRTRARHGHRRDAGAGADAGKPRACGLSHRLGRRVRATVRRRRSSPGRTSKAPDTRSGACCTERSPRCVCGFWRTFFELTRRQTRTRCRRRRTPQCTRLGAAFSSA